MLSLINLVMPSYVGISDLARQWVVQKKTHLYILFPNDHEIHQQKLPQNNGLFPKHKFTWSGFSLTSPAPSLMCFFNSPPCHHAFFAALAPPRFAPYPPSTPPQDHCKRSFSVNLWMEVSGHGVFRRRWIMKVKNRFPSWKMDRFFTHHFQDFGQAPPTIDLQKESWNFWTST